MGSSGLPDALVFSDLQTLRKSTKNPPGDPGGLDEVEIRETDAGNQSWSP
jgi:hypothetical protein